MPSAFAADGGWRDHDLPWLKRHVGRLTPPMTYRKSPQKAAARLAWDRFVRSNQPVIASTGLPDSMFNSVDHFDNFLSHGCLDHHLGPSSFRVEALNSIRYDAS